MMVWDCVVIVLIYPLYFAGERRDLRAGCDGLRTCSRSGDRELQITNDKDARFQTASTGFVRGL